MRSGRAVAEFRHGDNVAATVIIDARHETPNHQEATSARAANVLRQCRVGNVVRAESFALIFDADVKSIRGDRVSNADFLIRVQLVAVLNRVYQSLFEG